MSAIGLLPVLAHIQSHLEGDLSLASLAEVAGFSAGHFQRTFSDLIGETPREYVERVRLERAAFRLQIHEDSILTVALDVGYANHETFSRAFRRRFNLSPSQFRRRPALVGDAGERSSGGQGRWRLSPTKARRMKPIKIAFLRHVGNYEQVPPDLWPRLAQILEASGVPSQGTRVGVGHDSPAVTSVSQLRYDAGIVVPADCQPVPDAGLQELPSGPYAVTMHVGPYSTLSSAYPQIFKRAQGLKGFELVGLPVIEMYHEQRVDPERRVSYTDVYLPLRKEGAQ